MSDLWEKYGMTISVILFLSGVFATYMFNDALSFPAFEYRSSESSLIPIEPYDDIAELSSRFMWENRALDLIGQAFVITASVICCLTLLKPEEVEL